MLRKTLMSMVAMATLASVPAHAGDPASAATKAAQSALAAINGQLAGTPATLAGAAAQLVDSGALAFEPGRLRLLDRQVLQARACDCASRSQRFTG